MKNELVNSIVCAMMVLQNRVFWSSEVCDFMTRRSDEKVVAWDSNPKAMLCVEFETCSEIHPRLPGRNAKEHEGRDQAWRESRGETERSSECACNNSDFLSRAQLVANQGFGTSLSHLRYCDSRNSTSDMMDVSARWVKFVSGFAITLHAVFHGVFDFPHGAMRDFRAIFVPDVLCPIS